MTDITVPRATSRGRAIGYWLATLLVAFALGSGGVADVMRLPPVVEGMAQLGYPSYFCVILGIWKVLGALALLVPRCETQRMGVCRRVFRLHRSCGLAPGCRRRPEQASGPAGAHWPHYSILGDAASQSPA